MLHIFTQTPLEPAILERIDIGDDILLIEDAVIEALKSGNSSEQLRQLLDCRRICVLEPDMKVRGVSIEEALPGIKTVDYQGFLELTVENEVVHSWN